MADLDHPTKTTAHLIAASKVTGTDVYDLDGEKLGSIYDIMLNRASGRTEYAIMNFGGLFGIGQHYHPLPWSVLRYSDEKGGYVVNLDRKRLEGSPAYAQSDSAAWHDDTWGHRVDEYYGLVAV